MNTGRLSIALAAMLLAAACQTTAPRVHGLLSDSEIKEVLSDRIDFYNKGVGIVVGIVGPHERRIIAWGAQDRPGGKPVNGETIFDLESVTKVFTALLYADMVRSGEVAPDDPVSKYLPTDLVIPTQADGRKITLLDLASYTSTLPWSEPNLTPADPRNPYADYTLDQFKSFLAGFKPSWPIGSRYAYSNPGYRLLGFALSRRAGLTYEQLVRQRILDPLGMKDTGVINGEPPPKWSERVVTGHDSALKPTPGWDHPEFMQGSGALSSSANDMLNLLEAFAGLRQTPLASAMTDMTSNLRPSDQPDTLVGLGVGVRQRDGREIIWKSGGGDGAASWIGIDRLAQTAVVVLSNTGGIYVSDIGLHIFDPRSPLKAYSRRVALSLSRLDRFAGRYRFSDGAILNFTSDGDHLSFTIEGQPKIYSAVPIADSTFSTADLGTDTSFTFDFCADNGRAPCRVVAYQPAEKTPVDYAERLD